jgi:hypothetical protein
MRRIALYIIPVILLILAVQPVVSASCETECLCCQDTIKVIPVDSTETCEPIVTTSPADLMIFHTGRGPIENVWLLIVLNSQTYNALNKITIKGVAFMTKSDFKLVTTRKIPPVLPNSTTGYPGSLCQYSVSAIKDKMDEKGNEIYYGCKFFLTEITKTPTYFTLAFGLDSSISNLKGLVLALGRHSYCSHSASPQCCCFYPFDRCSSFSKSTLVVPEVATLVVTTAPFGALGLAYIIKRKKK